MAASAKDERPDGNSVAVVLSLCLSQISVDGVTHQDAQARGRIEACVKRIEDILHGRMTDDVRAAVQAAARALQSGQSEGVAAST